jgi:hypothetical protein
MCTSKNVPVTKSIAILLAVVNLHAGFSRKDDAGIPHGASARSLKKLKAAGVPNPVILAMVKAG